MTPEIAGGLLDVAAFGIVLFGVWLAATRSMDLGTWVLAGQALLLGTATIAVGLSRGSAELVAGGALTVALRAAILPFVIRQLLHASSVRHERQPYLGRRASTAIAIAIVFIAAIVVNGSANLPAGAPVPATASARAVPAAIAEVLTGLLLIATRRKSLSMVIGMLVFENGITFAALALTAGMPLVVELGASFDLLVVMVVVQIHARRMLTTMGTLSTDRLRSLRG
jgi:hydrogenase-4 component E